ncbi:hypothetical protein HPP92_025081 [Vanilla planifolia]|uniref:Uncharacterized protein n=1 Tax=Vanilla planifolia TaxID=51239 RepID=A0A835PJE4_VANPL|nr:hypothetical protein HPP92_025351 [Vanilla planifolia]KAG0453777.1 hypothetical protein HPP92_025081 [Vanilla planifolia]
MLNDCGNDGLLASPPAPAIFSRSGSGGGNCRQQTSSCRGNRLEEEALGLVSAIQLIAIDEKITPTTKTILCSDLSPTSVTPEHDNIIGGGGLLPPPHLALPPPLPQWRPHCARLRLNDHLHLPVSPEARTTRPPQIFSPVSSSRQPTPEPGFVSLRTTRKRERRRRRLAVAGGPTMIILRRHQEDARTAVQKTPQWSRVWDPSRLCTTPGRVQVQIRPSAGYRLPVDLYPSILRFPRSGGMPQASQDAADEDAGEHRGRRNYDLMEYIRMRDWLVSVGQSDFL